MTKRKKTSISIEDLASAALTDPRQVARDIRLGAPTGSVDAFIAWRAKHRSVKPDEYHVGRETARLRAAQAEQAELDVRMTRGELTPTEDALQILLLISAIFRTQLEAQPGRVANELAATTEPAAVRSILRDENRRILDSVCGEIERLSERISAVVESSVRDDPSVARPDPGSMGGPDASAPAGQC